MYFFEYGALKTFSTFDITHIIVILLSMLGIFMIFKKRNMIYSSSKSEKVGYFVGGFLLFLDVSFYVWKWANGVQTSFPIPMHLCSWATYIVALSFFIKKDWLFQFAFYYGTIGGLFSILVPEYGGYTYDHMRFYQFFLLHFIILAGPIYIYYSRNMTLNYKKWAPVVLGFMYVQAILADFVNDYFTRISSTGTVSNMLFTNKPPIPLGEGFLSTPVVYLLIFGMIFMVVWYGLVKLVQSIKVET